MKFYTVENKGGNQWYRVMEDGAQIIEIEFRQVGLAGQYDTRELGRLLNTHPDLAMAMMYGTLTPTALEDYLEKTGYQLFGAVQDDQKRVFDKIRKLLALARDTSGDVGEAAAANTKVLELMKRYNITPAQIAEIQKSIK